MEPRCALIAVGTAVVLLSCMRSASSAEAGNVSEPCGDIAATAYVSQRAGTCNVMSEPPAKPARRKAAKDEIVRAGETIECVKGGSLTLTFCASRADLRIAYSKTDPKAGRYLMPNVPRRAEPLNNLLQPALRIAVNVPPAEQIFIEGFDNGHPPAYHHLFGSVMSGFSGPGPNIGVGHREATDVLTDWLGRVAANRSEAFADLSKDSSRYSFSVPQKEGTYKTFTFCAGPDGNFSAPVQLAGFNLRSLKDSDGHAVGEDLYNAAKDGQIGELTSQWNVQEGSAPQKVTTYMAKVGDQTCGVNEWWAAAKPGQSQAQGKAEPSKPIKPDSIKDLVKPPQN